MSDPSRSLSLLLNFQGEELELTLFFPSSYSFLSVFRLKLSEIVPSLVEELELELKRSGYEFNSLESIYLFQLPSRWNSNRLVVTFVKTLALVLPITIYTSVGNASEKPSDLVEWLRAFKKIDWRELIPSYNSCPITST